MRIKKTTVGLEKDEDYYYVKHHHLSDNGSNEGDEDGKSVGVMLDHT